VKFFGVRLHSFVNTAQKTQPRIRNYTTTQSKGSADDEEIHAFIGKVHQMVMVKTVNPPQSMMNIFIVHRIRSRTDENDRSIYDQDYVTEKLSGF